MHHMEFIIWVCCFPVAIALERYIDFLRGRVYEDKAEVVASVVLFIAWVVIAVKLW